MKRPALLLLVAAVLASLAGCADHSSSDDGGPEGNGAASGAGATGSEVAAAGSLSTLPESDSLLFAVQADSGDLEAVEGSTDLT